MYGIADLDNTTSLNIDGMLYYDMSTRNYIND